MEKILVSACFLGENVRYDGGNQKLNDQQLALWREQKRLVAICPEVAGGLSIPRLPAEKNPDNQRVFNSQAEDVTSQFERGAQQALALCQRHQIRYALLKESSPSCGSEMIYDGSFSGNKISGQGVTSALLRQHGVQVFSEHNLEQLIDLINQSGER